MAVVRRVLDKKRNLYVYEKISFCRLSRFSRISDTMYFFLQTILELRHYNELYRDLIKCCPIRLRVFSEIKHVVRYHFTENPLEPAKR